MVVLTCQKDSYIKEATTKVISCKPAELKTIIHGKPDTIEGWEVVLEDTIFFPEGGGQPCDYGNLNEGNVENVRRNGSEVLHFVDKPFKPGAEVDQRIKWTRRFDHMQQHTGQHLITAIADKRFQFRTTSWALGDEVSHIELETKGEVRNYDIFTIESMVNEKIRQRLPVTVKVYEENDPFLTQTRTRGLPKDHVGSVRVVTIEGVESNMCCGTHVSNLSELQIIKLMRVEKGKKGKVNLFFLVGDRLLRTMAGMAFREQALTAILNNGPREHVTLVEKLMKSVKLSNKKLQNVLRDMAVLEANILKSKERKPKFYALHRKEAEMDFINTFVKTLDDTSILLFLTIGDEKEGTAYVVLHGEENLVAEFSPKITELMSAKGNCKGNWYQARVPDMSNRSKAITLIEKALGSS